MVSSVPAGIRHSEHKNKAPIFFKIQAFLLSSAVLEKLWMCRIYSYKSNVGELMVSSVPAGIWHSERKNKQSAICSPIMRWMYMTMVSSVSSGIRHPIGYMYIDNYNLGEMMVYPSQPASGILHTNQKATIFLFNSSLPPAICCTSKKVDTQDICSLTILMLVR